MTQGDMVPGSSPALSPGPLSGPQPANLGDILERVLDKGIVIAGDIKVNLLDIELLTIKLRLVIASLDTASQVGINWWQSDPWLNADAANGSSRAANGSSRAVNASGRAVNASDTEALEEENRQLRSRIKALEARSRDDG